MILCIILCRLGFYFTAYVSRTAAILARKRSVNTDILEKMRPYSRLVHVGSRGKFLTAVFTCREGPRAAVSHIHNFFNGLKHIERWNSVFLSAVHISREPFNRLTSYLVEMLRTE